MKYLMITTYPPMRCGIGAYAFQMAMKLQSWGNVVNILSPKEGDGDFTETIRSHFNLLHILKYGFFFDKIIFQYQQSFFYEDEIKKDLRSIIATHLSFFFVFLIFRNKVEIIIHETPRQVNYSPRLLDGVFQMASMSKINISYPKRDGSLPSTYFKLHSNKYELQEHSKYFYRFRDISKIDAKRELGIPAGKVVFLCIGFIQPHKGFDRTIRAFSKNSNRMELYVVGSLRVRWGEYVNHLEDLKNMAKGINNIHIIEEYLSDEKFDTWIIASDIVVVPYKEIWSSGVLARAKLFGKPIIAADVGGLSEQTDGKDIIFEDDMELQYIFDLFSEEISCNYD